MEGCACVWRLCPAVLLTWLSEDAPQCSTCRPELQMQRLGVPVHACLPHAFIVYVTSFLALQIRSALLLAVVAVAFEFTCRALARVKTVQCFAVQGWYLHV